MTIRKSKTTPRKRYEGQHRFEHWYQDNQVHFITSRCRDKFEAFKSERAKQIFWTQFDKCTVEFGFVPWVTSLLTNHYHTLGYLKVGENLPRMIQRLHGSVAKLVNDTLEVRWVPFWIDSRKQNYFDGCIRDELQARRAFQYTRTQCSLHFICARSEDYPHTRVSIDIEAAVKRALELKAFLEGFRTLAARTGDGSDRSMPAEACTPGVRHCAPLGELADF